ncbi:MAG: desulforedoxin [Proteobacteria bacterium]|nr:desulforedoxin [Pseudomonadota bacterium]
MSKLGKRYQCEECGTVALCTKPSDQTPSCCGKEMEVQQPKKKPSSD